jgi:enoyl-CoA hydratase/carnithine racemase
MEPDRDILFEVTDSIGILTLNLPPENYLPAPEFLSLQTFRDLAGDETLKGLIIRGAGKNFSAGGNLDTIFRAAGTGRALEDLLQAGHRLFLEISRMEIPVIAAINRVCFGGGLEIALACHIRVASENALLAFPEVNSNLMPGMGGTFRLPAAVGLFESARLVMGGDMIGAAEAKAMGLVDFVAPRDQAFEYAFSLMLRMTHDRPVKVIRHIMKALKNAADLAPDEAMHEETRLFCDLARDEAERRRSENGR